MTDLRTAAQQAYEALWYYHATEFGRDTPAGKAIAAFHAALAQQAEPVESVKHKHQWFSTGAMEPGEMRCIQCGAWAKEKNT